MIYLFIGFKRDVLLAYVHDLQSPDLKSELTVDYKLFYDA